jgi:hypothetical protein
LLRRLSQLPRKDLRMSLGGVKMGRACRLVGEQLVHVPPFQAGFTSQPAHSQELTRAAIVAAFKVQVVYLLLILLKVSLF